MISGVASAMTFARTFTFCPTASADNCESCISFVLVNDASPFWNFFGDCMVFEWLFAKISSWSFFPCFTTQFTSLMVVPSSLDCSKAGLREGLLGRFTV